MYELLENGMIFLRDVVDNKFANIFSTLEFDLSFQNTLTHENTLHVLKETLRHVLKRF